MRISALMCVLFVLKNLWLKKFTVLIQTKDLTPLIVRDAIVECFYQAHCIDSKVGMENENINRGYCETIIKKAFQDSGGNFDNPSKESTIKAMDYLAEFSKGFRSQDIIKKHYNEIMALVNKL